MEMRCLKENVLMDWRVGSGQSQAVVEGEMTLPGGLREEAHVLYTGGMAVINSAEAMQDRLVLSGRVVFHALYTQGDPDRIQSIEASADFTHTMELPGVQQRMLCQADCMVEKTSSSTSGGRLMLRAYVRCYARVLSQQPVEALSGIAGCEGLETRMQDVQCRRTVATGSSETMLREEFDLPAPLNVKDTLFATAQVQQVDVTGGQGRAGVTGTLLMDVCHAGGNPAQPIVITQHAVPFMHTVELNGEAGDMLGHILGDIHLHIHQIHQPRLGGGQIQGIVVLFVNLQCTPLFGGAAGKQDRNIPQCGTQGLQRSQHLRGPKGVFIEVYAPLYRVHTGFLSDSLGLLHQIGGHFPRQRDDDLRHTFADTQITNGNRGHSTPLPF